MKKEYLNKMGRITVILTIMMIASLAIFGTVYADDGQVAEDPPETPAVESEISAEESMSEDAEISTGEENESPPEDLLSEEVDDPPPERETSVAENQTTDDVLNEPDQPLQEEGSGQELDQEIIEEQETEQDLEQEEETGDEENEAIAETTAALAENDITLMDGNGEAVDMASESSLDAVSGADPWWMVGKVKYAYVKSAGACPSDTTLGVTCFVDASTPITSALNYMDANNLVPSDGILHIEADSYTENILINGTSGNGYLAKLKGLVSDGSSADTTINGDINIANTLLGFKLSGFTVLGSIDIHNNTGTATLTDLVVTSSTGTGILVTNHTGKVQADRVKSNGNKYYGMYVDNTAGTYSVTITNSEFSHNNDGLASTYRAGLWIKTNSTISLNGVSASHNDGNGATLDAVKGTTVKNGVFNNNFSDPILVNQGIGLYINNSPTTNNVYIENVQTDGNDNHGILLSTSGKITMKNVNAYNNGAVSGYDGIMINNGYGVGTISITNSTSNDSGGKGFHILSHNSVTINGITAINNGGDGVYIDNCDFDWGGSWVCKGKGSVKISGKLPNTFNLNGENGLRILSGGSVTLSYFQADSNTSNGVHIEADQTGSSGSVTLNLSYKPPIGDWLNSASHNTQNGINIESFGNIFIDKCVAELNGNHGALLDNSAAVKAKKVTVKNSRFMNNTNDGLHITSKGSVVLTYVDAYENVTGSGVDITNTAGTGAVSIYGSKTVNSDFTGNAVYGIRVQSGGSVTIKYVLATGNQNGAAVFNSTTEGKSISISYSDFSGSTGGMGLDITSKGVVTLTNVVSSGNATGGLYLSNEGAAKARSVKITNGQFNGNVGSSGIAIYTFGSVTLKGVQSNGNTGYGGYIDTCRYDGGIPGCRGIGSVTITGTDNQFNSNGMIGLSVYSRAGVSIVNIMADSNVSSGIYINHSYDNYTGSVSLSASKKGISSVSQNGYSGLNIASYGNISVQRFEINNNSETGAFLSNQDSPVDRKVSIAYTTLNDNQGSNLVIYSTGAVSLTGVQTLRASKHFWEIDDDNGQICNDRLPFDPLYDEIWYFNGTSAQSITVDLISVMFDAYLELYDENWNLLEVDDNDGGGTDAQIAYTLGATGMYYLRVSSADADGYGVYQLDFDGPNQTTLYTIYYGVNINNTLDDGTGSVKISAPKGSYGLDTRDNNYTGLRIYTNGSISMTGVDASYNGGNWGAYIQNNTTAAEGKSVKIKNSNFDNNDKLGIELYSKGVISWSGGSANGNLDTMGAQLVNNGSSTYRSVSLTNLEFNDNETYGLSVSSLGSIKVKNVGASGNTTWGAILNNCQYSSECQGYGNITISGTYGTLEFNENGSFGLQVSSRGTISLTNVNAWGNSSYGVYLSNEYVNAYGNVVVKSGSKKTLSRFSDNGGDGLSIDSMGTVTLSYIEAIGNNGDGVQAYNGGTSIPKKVYMTGAITGSNTGYGIFVSSKGAISLSNIIDWGSNVNGGISLYNASSIDPQTISLTRVTVEGNTTSTGIKIESKGNVTLNNVSANNNNYGARIDNTAGTDSKITLLNSKGDNTFSGNTLHGMEIDSNGVVSLSGVVAEWNGFDGINLDTSSTLKVYNLRLSRNSGNGLFAVADLGASIKNLYSFNNGSTGNGDGLYLYMNTGSLAKIIYSVLAGNYGNGIELTGDSNPVLTGTMYFGNDLNNTGELNLLIH